MTDWQTRFEELEKEQFEESNNFFQELAALYLLTGDNIKKEISNWFSKYDKINLSEANKLLSPKELSIFKTNVKQYLNSSVDSKWIKELEDIGSKVRVSRLNALTVQTQQHVETLYKFELDGLENLLKNIYSNGYYKNGYELQKGLNFYESFSKLDSDDITKLLYKSWTADGQRFSDRIWTKKATLVDFLNTELTQSIVKGEKPNKLIDKVVKKFDVTRGQAGRLIHTESSYFYSAAQEQAFRETGVEKFRFVATLDDRTSDICREMDGKVFNMSEWEVGVTVPPLHCNCRSTTTPHFEGNVKERFARGGNIKEDLNYKEWYKKYVKGN